MLVDEIAAKLGMDISDVLAQLTELELYGTVKSYPGKNVWTLIYIKNGE